ncbi:MAG: lamin tail domain-containing protein [Bacteroidetes bacterium]|nr:lamin tail domain-containing protein [Bacteroidota bacterium]
MKKLYFLFAILIFSVNLSWGQIAQFNFPATSSLVVSTKDANVTVSDMTLSAGTIETNIVTGTYFSNEPYIEESSGWIATDQASAKSFTFTITANSGYEFSITNISFNAYATSAGPSAFSAEIDGASITAVDAPSEVLVSYIQAISKTGLTSAVIKIQGWLNGSRTSTGSGVFKLDDVIITGNVSAVSSPILIVSTSTLNNFAYIESSGPSTSQSYNLSGSNLTGSPGNITVTGSTNYEVSTDNSSFSGLVNVPYSSATLSSTPIYVRLKAGLSAGNFNSEDVTNAGGGATTQNVTCSGTVYKVEPTNHATNFASALGSPSHTAMDLTWTDATGGTLPDGYLIKGSSTSYVAIVDPVDGTAESDGGLLKNIAQGTQSGTINNLSASTTYYFKIFPYTNSGSNINYKTDGTIPQASSTTNGTPTIVINEIHADPDPTGGDANGDGSVDIGDDEFVELVNIGEASLDISNWTISDAIGVKHTFPSSTIIPANESIVVFGGGTPTNIPGTSQVASSGSLNLNNTGDDVILKNTSGNVIQIYTYGSEGGDNQSVARNPNLTGSFVKHSTIATNPVLFSPGKNNENNSPLPVTLTSFTAEMEDGKVLLNWETATELNNYGFSVERNSVSLNNDWTEIGFVPGSGNSNSPKQYSLADENPPSAELKYRLKQIDFNGKFEYYDLIAEVDATIPTSVDEGSLPADYALFQNYPNPFNPRTVIKFQVPSSKFVKLQVYDMLGREIQTLVDEYKPQGVYEVSFDASSLTSGLYFYKLTAGNFVQTKKLVLLK